MSRHGKGADAKAEASPGERGHYSKGLAKGDPKGMDGATAFAKSTPALASFSAAPASVTYACGPDFDFDHDKVSPTLWDKRFEEDLFRGGELPCDVYRDWHDACTVRCHVETRAGARSFLVNG